MAGNIGNTQIDGNELQMCCLLHSSPPPGQFVSKGTGRGPATENTLPLGARICVHSNTILRLSTPVLIPKKQDK